MNAPATLEIPYASQKKKRAARKTSRRAPRERELQCARPARAKRAAVPARRSPASGHPGGQLLASLRSVWHCVLLVLRPFHVRYASRRLRTVETLALGNRRAISLVQVDGQDFLLGTTPGSLSLLARLERPREKVAELPLTAQLFANVDSRVQ